MTGYGGWNYKDKNNMNKIKSCEKCSYNRWRTVEKNKTWSCRKCGNARHKK